MKPVLKILKWFFLILFVVMAAASVVSMVSGDPDAVYALIFSVICIALILMLSRKRKPGTAAAPVKPAKKQAPIAKFTRYKGFEIENFNIDNLNGLFVFNEEFDYSVSEIKENNLEDFPIYKFEFHLKPEFTRSESGAMRIMAEGRVIGDLSEKTALAMKEFINSHDGCKPSLEIKGGTFKYYDSDEKELTTEREPWTAKLLVSYYE